MLFNSIEFFIFFTVVFGLYIVLPYKWQNRMLLLASYFFYGFWDWRFLSLILFSTVLDYFCGLKIYNAQKVQTKKLFVLISVLGNLSILGFFKYFNFFCDSLTDVIQLFGLQFNLTSLNIILPMGISFYTFQTISYSVDIYRKEVKPTKNFFDFALFVAFFPQLVAGPIERAKSLLPQILQPRKLTLDKFYEGCYLIFWGLFLKIFIADNLANTVESAFINSPDQNGVKILLGVYAFSWQIFCDFAGYTHIARGIGKCLGFNFMLNFNLPYFATNPSDFWKRWHISLSSWLKDYLYIPLGGNRKGKLKTYRNLFITMFLGGLWHGAAWTFVIWGAYHGLLLSGYRLIKDKFNTSLIPKFLSIILFYHLTCIGWLIFRAESFTQLTSLFNSLLFNFHVDQNILELRTMLKEILFYVWILIVVQFIQYKKNDLMHLMKTNYVTRAVLFYICFYLIIIFGVDGGQEFIYFQF